jgi:hypothetical protein
MPNDRSETGFKLSAKNGSIPNYNYHVNSSFRKIVFFHFNRFGANQVILVRNFAVISKAAPFTLKRACTSMRACP